jgi:hypothetical protein
MRLALVLVLVACGGSPKAPLRPLATGTFGKYKIEPCATGGHAVKLTYEVDERGEAANKLLVQAYRDRYLVPRLKDAVEIQGWAYDSQCVNGGLTVRINTPGIGEALHRIGETLAKNPTDIEVTVVGPK